MRAIHIFLLATLLMLCGCGKDAKSSEAKEERNPLIKQGQAYLEIKDYKKAEAAFKEAIENDPRMARPHLDLATIYHQYRPDYVSAIHHYRRYLELRPDSEKAEFIREQIGKVEKALIDEILTRSGAFQIKEECDRLRKENAALKQQLADQGETSPAPAQQATASTQQKTVTETVPKSAKPTVPSQVTHRIYTVVTGDNLTKIANRFYGNANWEPIYEANRDRMSSPGDLREGQTLVIPVLKD